MISLNNVTKIYKDGSVGITDVNLDLPDCGLVLIKGKSGSGKTTLLNLIAGIIRPTSGEILYDNKDISNIPRYTLTKISYIYQNYNLFADLDVKSNINYFNSDDHIFDDLNIRYLADKKISEISGGEARRVAIARAINKNNDVLLCDEPTESLDKENSKIIIDMLKSTSENRLVVVVSHESKYIESYADIVIEVSESKIVTIKSINKVDCTKNQDRNDNKLSNLHSSIIKHTIKRMKNKKLLGFLNSLVLFFSLIILFLSFLITSIDYNRIEIHNLISHNKTRLSIDFEYDNIDNLMKEHSDLQIAYNYLKVGNMLNTTSEYNPNIFYKGFYGEQEIVPINDYTFTKNDKIYGSLPVDKNEVIITEYLFECMKNLGINTTNGEFYPSKYDDILNKEISFGDITLKVSGVLLQDIKDYEFLKEHQNVQGRKLEVYSTLFDNDLIKYNYLYITSNLFNEIAKEDLSISNIFINSDNESRLYTIKSTFNVYPYETTSAYSDIIKEFYNMMMRIKEIFVFLMILSSIVLIIFILYYLNTSIHNKKNEIINMFYLGLSKASIAGSCLLELVLTLVPSLIILSIVILFSKDILNSIFKTYFIIDLDFILYNGIILLKMLIYTGILFIIMSIFIYRKLYKLYKDIYN